MDRTPLPIDEGGNGARLKTIVIDEADAYMLVRALSIAVTTAMMCSGKESVRRLQYYKQQLAELAPSCANLLRNSTDLCEIAILSAQAETWSVYRVRERQWSNKARTVVKVGDRLFGSSDLFENNSGCHQAIITMVSNIVPLTCVQQEVDDVVGNPWFCG